MKESKEETYIIENCKSFEPKEVFNCGQCFRWDEQQDGSYIGIFDKNVLNVKKQNDKILISGICEGNLQDVCNKYFDLERNYEDIKERLSMVDKNLEMSIKYGSGIRILNQNLWETIISFITSANNNIPRIKGILSRLSKKYGHEIEFRGNKYYTFPTIDDLSKANIEDLREIGLGFRDKYIYFTTQMIKNGDIDLKKIENEKDINVQRKLLMQLQGVGPKVADCILLFSTLKRFDVFPIDVWVRRVMNDLYIHNSDENKVNKREIEELADKKFGELKGIAQQYLFYWIRENEKRRVI